MKVGEVGKKGLGRLTTVLDVILRLFFEYIVSLGRLNLENIPAY